MSTMAEAARQYLRLRRSLGYKLEVPGRLVQSFAGHLDALGITHVTADAAAEWATAPRNAEPYWHWLRMSAVRGFAVYLHSLDPRHQVPPSDMLPRHYTRPAPYLFGDDEIAALIRAAGRMRHGPAVTASAARSGMRGNPPSEGGASFSVAGRPRVLTMPTPEVTISSFGVPATASPSAAIARCSFAQLSANLEKS